MKFNFEDSRAWADVISAVTELENYSTSDPIEVKYHAQALAARLLKLRKVMELAHGE